MSMHNLHTYKTHVFIYTYLYIQIVIYIYTCNGPGVVQRRDRQKKEFHDQSDYR